MVCVCECGCACMRVCVHVRGCVKNRSPKLCMYGVFAHQGVCIFKLALSPSVLSSLYGCCLHTLHASSDLGDFIGKFDAGARHASRQSSLILAVGQETLDERDAFFSPRCLSRLDPHW